MMEYISIVVTILQLLYIKEGNAYSSGAPLQVCSSLTPIHGGPLSGVSPFTIGVKQTLGDKLQVTISSSKNTEFKGFIVQARKTGSTTPLGIFVNLPQNARGITCGAGIDEDTVTHSNSDEKTRVTFEWNPPAGFRGKILFNATVLVDFLNYWQWITSDEISLPLGDEVQQFPTQSLPKSSAMIAEPRTTMMYQPVPHITGAFQRQATPSGMVQSPSTVTKTSSQIPLPRETEIAGGLSSSTIKASSSSAKAVVTSIPIQKSKLVPSEQTESLSGQVQTTVIYPEASGETPVLRSSSSLSLEVQKTILALPKPQFATTVLIPSAMVSQSQAGQSVTELASPKGSVSMALSTPLAKLPVVGQTPSFHQSQSVAQRLSTIQPLTSSLVRNTTLQESSMSQTLSGAEILTGTPSLVDSPSRAKSSTISLNMSSSIIRPLALNESLSVDQSSSLVLSIIKFLPKTEEASFTPNSLSANQTLPVTLPSSISQFSTTFSIANRTGMVTGPVVPTQTEILPSTSQLATSTTSSPRTVTIVEISIKQVFDKKFEDKMSDEYLQFTEIIKIEIESVYMRNNISVEVNVLSLRPGSIIARVSIVFKDHVDASVQPLESAISDNKLGKLNVDSSLKILDLRVNDCASKCHPHATCTKASCKCNPGYTGDGLQCTKIKKIVTARDDEEEDDDDIKKLLIASLAVVSIILLFVLVLFMCLLCRICKNK